MAGPRIPIIAYDMNMGLFETSTGHRFSSAEWLDLHYGAAEPEYEAMVRSVGFQAGWQVLDAGCGNGRFTSVIAEIVGTKGCVDAVDLNRTPQHWYTQAASGIASFCNCLTAAVTAFV